jgi:ubiquinone/menaquinone biosynthesis C-methylase UbiE
MSQKRNQRVCPAEAAGALDNGIRRWLQNPAKLLSPHIKPGMKILDIGCGPGFFTLELARLTGAGGHVTAADLQQGMLDRIASKIKGTGLSERITLHLCKQDRIGLAGEFDFILAFYMVHEVPDQTPFFNELSALLKPGGSLLIIEPKFHVSGKAFERTCDILFRSGFRETKKGSTLLNREILVTCDPDRTLSPFHF